MLTFEGLKNQEQVLNDYDGGFGSLGSGPGPSYGIQFGSSALALIDQDNGGTGNFANEPTSKTIAFFRRRGVSVHRLSELVRWTAPRACTNRSSARLNDPR